MKHALVLSCEHGGNRVPARYRSAFRGSGPALRSHRGWDPGALQLARQLARGFDAPLLACTTTRLLVDPNRSLGHPSLCSEWARHLPAEERVRIVARWWRPHREAVERAVRERLGEGRVLHLSVHSFTPRWKGRARTVDVGLLYDPSRAAESSFVDAWLGALGERRRDLRLRRNRPYRGDSDGLTTSLRGRLGAREYLGIELETSQRFCLGSPAAWRSLRRDLVESLREILA